MMIGALLAFGVAIVLGQEGRADSSLLPIDSNGRLAENVLLVLDTATERWTNLAPIGRRKILVSAKDDLLKEGDVAACLWKGYPPEYSKDSMNTATEEDDPAEFKEDLCDHLEMGFISYFTDETLTITWINPVTGQLTDAVQNLDAGEKNTAWIHTVPTHKFMVKGKNYERIFEAQVPSIFTVGTKPDYTTLGKTITEANKIGRVRMELSRVRNIKRVFTDVGFKKIKVPRDVWAEVST